MKTDVCLLISGDFAPLLNPVNIRQDHFDALKPLLVDVDAHITNLECPLTIANQPITKSGPAIKSNPENIQLLKHAGVTIACMANNHIFDFFDEGLLDTIKICEQNQIDPIGIVNRPDGKPHWLIKQINGKKIGFLNYCEHEFSVRQQGLLGANGFDALSAWYDINELKQLVNFVIVIYHGGNEYFNLPNPEVKRIFHYLADIGADAVIGHHTHVYSGYEIYNHKPLVYSIGNFFFPFDNEPLSWHIGLICKLKLNQKIELEIFPIVQCNKDVHVKLIEDQDKSMIMSEILNLSNIISDDVLLHEHWAAYAKGLQIKYLKRLPGLTKPQRFLLGFDKKNQYIIPNKRLVAFLNILKCQSHLLLLKNSINNQIIR